MTARKNNVGCAIWVVLGVGTVGALALGSTSGSGDTSFTDDDTRLYTESSSYSTSPPIQGFSDQQSRELAAGLAEAEAVHGVCFGWALTDGSDKTTQRGSSRGPTTPAETCSKWAEVQVSVANAPGNGDYDYDYASISTSTSPDLTDSPGVDEFTALGFTAERLVEEPAQETAQAALSLPLLLVESGALPAPPPAKGDPNAAPAQDLPPAGSSDGGFGTWAWIILLTLAAVVFSILGLRGRSKAKRHDPPAPGPPPQVGAPTAPPPPPGFPTGPQHPQHQGFPAQGRPAPPWQGQPSQPPPPPGYQYPQGPPPPPRGPYPGPPPPQQPGPPPGWPGQQPPR